MRLPSQKRSRTRLRGLTFIETTFGLFVLVVSTGLVAQVLLVSTTISNRVERQQSQLRQSVDLLRDLPRLLREVTPPLWADPRTLVRVEGADVIVAYYRGDRNQVLTIRADDRAVEARAGDLIWRWETGSSGTIRPWISEDRAIGIEWQATGAPPVRISWGSQCL